MSDDNNNNNNNDDDNNDNKNNKITFKLKQINDISLNNIKLPPIDISNNIFRTLKINPILNRNLLLLDTCKEKKLNLSKSSKEIIKKNQLNISKVNNNKMTINKIIDNIKERREKNNKERFNKYKNFIKELDRKEKKENTLLLEDKKKQEMQS